MADEEIYDPVKDYQLRFAPAVAAESRSCFEKMLQASQVDEEQNRILNEKLSKAQDLLNQANKGASKTRVARILCTLLGVVLLLAGVLLPLTGAKSNTEAVVKIVLSVVFVVGGIALMIGINVWGKKKARLYAKQQSDSTQGVNRLAQQCNESMAPLNRLFDSAMPDEVFAKAIPEIHLDPGFDLKKLQYLAEKGGFPLVGSDPNVSTLLVRSGSVKDNPFLILRTLKGWMGNQTYTGTRVVTWTETRRGSDGKTYVEVESETLVATIVRPCPFYKTEEFLVYLNAAAPDLKFTRMPQVREGSDEKELERLVKKREKENRKRQEKATKTGSGYTQMANTKFEGLFNATNRNNEVQFRLMFTPLAQTAMVNLLTQSPYGDDFQFIKDGVLNYVYCLHSQQDDKYASPQNFTSGSVERSRKAFIEYCENYSQSLYFEIAPILAIPLYQQTSPILFDYVAPSYNESEYQHEMFANFYPRQVLDHPSSTTLSIRKSAYLGSKGNMDYYRIHSSSYQGVPRVAIVPTLCRNGRYYNVDVHWTEYFPLSWDSVVMNEWHPGTEHELADYLKKEDIPSRIESSARANSLLYGRNFYSFVLRSMPEKEEAPDTEENRNERIRRQIESALSSLQRK